MKAVVALGGNALTRVKDKGTYKELIKNIRESCSSLIFLIKKGYDVAIVVGSGPQIGELLIQGEIARKKVPEMPLDVLDAEVQGWLGYLIQQQLSSELRKLGIKRKVITLITQVLVDKDDKNFKNPTKPVGPYYNKKQSLVLGKKGYKFVKIRDLGYRRAVASPMPIKILEKDIIKKLISEKTVVIAAGGGGIPVVRKNKKIVGVEAVIDKDLAASCLAKEIRADFLLILTDVKRVYLNFRNKNQIPIKKLKIKEALKFLRQNQFPAGSMGPKIQAAINFLKSGGKKAIITNPQNIKKALEGKEGTLII